MLNFYRLAMRILKEGTEVEQVDEGYRVDGELFVAVDE